MAARTGAQEARGPQGNAGGWSVDEHELIRRNGSGHCSATGSTVALP